MSRPMKQGIDYFALDVDFFQNFKVKKIIKGCGFQSSSVLICLLSNIYRKDGYYLKWNEDMPFLLADELGNGAGERMVTEVLQKALREDFFDAGIFENYGVLTSKEIQRRFFVAAERRRQILVDEKIFLLDDEETPKNAVRYNAITMPKNAKNASKRVNVDNNSINVCKNSIIVGNNPQSKVKYITTTTTGEGEKRVFADKNSVIAYKNEVNVNKNSVIAYKNPVNVDKNPINVCKNSPEQSDDDDGFAKIINIYSNNIHPVTPFEAEKLADLKESYSAELIVKAIERAVIRGKRNFGYIAAILRRWEESGIDDEKPKGAKSGNVAGNIHKDKAETRYDDFADYEQNQEYPWDVSAGDN